MVIKTCVNVRPTCVIYIHIFLNFCLKFCQFCNYVKIFSTSTIDFISKDPKMLLTILIHFFG